MSYQHCADRGSAQTKKWACAHWCASPNAGTTQQFSIPEYTLVRRKRQTTEPVLGRRIPRVSWRRKSSSRDAATGETVAPGRYWKFEIRTTLLLRLPRAKASCLPSSDQAKSKIRSVLKCVSCLRRATARAVAPRDCRLPRESRHTETTCCQATRTDRTFRQERQSDRPDLPPCAGTAARTDGLVGVFPHRCTATSWPSGEIAMRGRSIFSLSFVGGSHLRPEFSKRWRLCWGWSQ